MVLKRFRVQIALRVLLLAAAISLAVYLAPISWLAAVAVAALAVFG